MVGFRAALLVFVPVIYELSNNAVVAGPVEFKKFVWHDGFSCPDNLTSFKVIRTLPLATCLLKCKDKATCIGVKYEPFRMQCTGCRWYLPDLELIQTPGLAHYNRDVYRLITDNFRWYEAKANCESLGGRLADIKSMEEQRFIEDNFLPSTVNLYWVGGRYISGAFSWLDGTAVSSSFEFWYPGEPNQGEGAVEYCIMLYQRADNTAYTWNDAPCDSQNFLIGSLCEFTW